MNRYQTAASIALVLAGLAAVTLPAMVQARGMGDRMGGEFGGPMFGGPAAEMLFENLDANADGSVTAEEVATARTALVTGIDANSDGLLTAEELTAHNMRRMEQIAAARAAEMIARQDANADGQLSVAELAVPAAPVAIFDRLDADGDGAVSRAEFDEARERMAERRGGRRGHHRPFHGRPDAGPDAAPAE